MDGLIELQKVIKIMQVLEKDDILLDALADVLLFDPGNPNVPYSTPLIPKRARIARLVEYLHLLDHQNFDDLDKES